MKRVTQITFAMICISMMMGLSCSRRPSRISGPSFPGNAGSQAMAQYDTNKDGKVAEDELENAPSLRAAIKNLDTNGDGGVDAKEVDGLIDRWIASKLGRTDCIVTVTRNGDPLDGATVKLVPEKFLGGAIQGGEGTTNEFGQAAITGPMPDGSSSPMSGVSPGLYIIQVTKDGESIPAEYNSSSKYGVEVSMNSAAVLEGCVVDIE